MAGLNDVESTTILDTVVKDLIDGLQKSYDDFSAILQERNSQLDILCKLKNGDYVAIEVQVAKHSYWDNRALAYISSVYGNQLRKSGKWKDLKKW